MAVTLVSIVILFSGKVLDVLGDAREVIGAVGATLVLAGAVAGALYHPVRRFWWRGAVAGMAATGGSFLAARFYGRVRPEPFGHEFAVVALLGAIPAIMMYYWLMKGQLVTASEVARLRGAAEQGDEADER